MVSIAESLNYRIFERKWRPGEAFIGLPRACRILSVEQKPKNKKSLGLFLSARRPVVSQNCWEKGVSQRPSGYPESPSQRRFMGNLKSIWAKSSVSP